MKKKLKNLEQFEEAVKAVRNDMNEAGEFEKIYLPADPYYQTVDKIFNFWKTGWFLIMVKYNIDIETTVRNGYRVKIGEDE